MRLNDHGRKDGHDRPWDATAAAALAASLIITACLIAALLANLDALRPRVGDIVVFRPTTQQQDAWQIEVPTDRPTELGRTSCVLDPAVMIRQGGSLMVEARDDANPDRQYRLHWAGAHSASGQGDCAGSADLQVSHIELQKLATAAGGFGVNRGVMR